MLRRTATKLTGPRVVIIGGVAGGATAAARLMRVDSSAHVTVVERMPDVSIAGCGLPYYLGREITDRSQLALHSPQSLKKSIGVSQVLTLTEALSIDAAAKTVLIRSLRTGLESSIPYDKLLMSPGAKPFMPPSIAAINDPRIVSLRNLADVDRIDAILHNDHCREVVVVGAGFIGLEMAEQLHRIGKRVTIVEKLPHVLPQADDEMARFLHHSVTKQTGMTLITCDGIAAIEPEREHVFVRLESGKTIPADMVVMSIGVRPDTQLAQTAGIKCNPRGLIIVDDYMRTNVENVYAVGDAVECRDLVFPERRSWVALGNVANMQARIAADHMATGKSIPYCGSLGTAIVRCFDQVLAITGWTETRLKAENIPYQTVTITQPHHAGYYPGAQPLTIKITFDPDTGRLFGAQAVGTEGVDKRIDVIATAITGGLTIEDLSLTQLTYSPPFGAARDPANVAGLAARNIRDGLVKPTTSMATGRDEKDGKRVELLDIRVPCDQAADPIPGARHIVYWDLAKEEVRATLDKDVRYKTICNWGKTSYFAHRHLRQAGFDAETIVGGRRVQSVRDEAKCSDNRPVSKL